jgi:UDP-2,3-diacylglucosamine hydrolase
MFLWMMSLLRKLKLLPSDRILFISDIHLSAHDEQGVSRFIEFIKGPAQTASKLYILGDLFDVWVGEDLNIDFQCTIQDILAQLAKKGVELFFMGGNRDFLVNERYLKKAHCQKLTDPTIINLHNIPTLLTHGDKLCTQDIAYQRYRMIAQNPLVRFLFLRLPKKTRQRIGQQLREKSRRYQQQQDSHILDVHLPTVDAWFSRYNVKQMIHGHVHRPAVHESATNKRLVLGDWFGKISYIQSSSEQIALIGDTEP